MVFSIFNSVSKKGDDHTKTETKMTLDLSKTTPIVALAGMITMDPYIAPIVVAIAIGLYIGYEHKKNPKLRAKKIQKTKGNVSKEM